MKILEQELVYEIRQTVMFSNSDIVSLLGLEAQKITDLSCARYKVSIEEQTEGSPPYKVGYKARVDLVMPCKPPV